MEYRHVAYNLYTGEILSTQQGRYLKKLVAQTGGKGWIFSHAGFSGITKKLGKTKYMN